MAILTLLLTALCILAGLFIRQLVIIWHGRREHGGVYLSWLAFVDLNDRQFEQATQALHERLRGAETAQQQEVRRA